LLSRGNNTFQVSSSDLSHTESREIPTELKFEFKLNNYVKSYQDETYFNFSLDKNELKYTLEKTRGDIPLEMKYTLDETTCVDLELPPNTECTYLPENSSYIKSDYGYSIEYQKKKDSIVMRKHFFCNKLLILPAEFDQWTALLNSMNKAYNESIILKQKK
jgi:hypothetical protein